MYTNKPIVNTGLSQVNVHPDGTNDQNKQTSKQVNKPTSQHPYN